MRNRFYLLALVIIFLVAFLFRFYKLGEVPYGFYQDESAIGYNAFSISQTGKDEHGQFLPLYFKSFGDYKLPVYIYTTIIPVKLFGLTEFAVRFPSALFSFLTVPVFYLFLHKLTKRRDLSLIASSLLAINPWHLHYGRATFEVSIALFFFVAGAFLLYLAFAKNTQGAFLVGTMCFVMSFYTYNLTRLLAPALFFLVVWFYGGEGKRVGKKELVATLILSILLLVPFAATLFGRGGAQSAAGTFLFSSAVVQASLLEFRSYLVDLPTVFTKLFFNMLVLTIWQYLQNIASYLSVGFLFISGSSHGNHGIGNVGQFYLFELPLMVIGVIGVIGKIRVMNVRKLFLGWVVVVVLVASLTREAPHATRSFFLIGPLVTFSALGVLTLWHFLRRIKSSSYRLVLTIITVAFMLYNLIYYFTSYYIRFPMSYAKAWRSEDKALSFFLLESEVNYEKIIIDKSAGFVYTSLLFYQKIPPASFLASSVYAPPDSEGFTTLVRFGKYEFKDIDWVKDLKTPKALLITSAERKPEDVVPLRVFTYPTRPVVIATKQEIAQYPAKEVAYVVIETR